MTVVILRFSDYIPHFSLLLVSIIWGATFPLVKVSLYYISPMGFLTMRFLLAALIIFIAYFQRIFNNITAMKASLILGIFLFLGYAFQTIGLKYTTSSNAGFITGLYVVFTPLFSHFIVREKITWRVITSLFLSVIGLYFISDVHGLNFGDFLELLCAVAYGIHVSLIGKFSREYDASSLTMLQLFFVFLFSSFFWTYEGFNFNPTPILIFGIIFTGIFASALGIFVQVRAQRKIPPARAAIIFTTEPVFAGLFSWIFLGEVYGYRGIIGSSLIILAMLLSISEKVRPEL